MEQFSTRTLRYLRGLVGDSAEDVQQEVWLSVYRHIAGVANPGAFRTWLFRTTRHRALDFLRKERRERELIVDVPIDAVSESLAADDDPEPVDALLPDDAFAELTAPQREVLLLRYRDDMSYAEIALIVGCSIGTVRSRLHYAKLRLQELISQKR
jgi:RNA polymerase sigma-70 factor (ECF subfamily)